VPAEGVHPALQDQQSVMCSVWCAGYPVPAEGVHPAGQDQRPERFGQAQLRAGGLPHTQPQRCRHPAEEVRALNQLSGPKYTSVVVDPAGFFPDSDPTFQLVSHPT
jgi:hypothetical protein